MEGSEGYYSIRDVRPPLRTDPARRRVLRLAAGLPALLAMSGAQALVQRALPRGGGALPAIGLGTWQTFDVGSDPPSRAPLSEVLRAFDAAGGRVVDSSPMYGAAESVVGDLAAGLGLQERLFFATKVWTSGRAEGIRQMEQSFRRLRVKRMDLMQVHNLVDAATHLKTLEGWKKDGRVRFVGVTHYSASAHAEVERALKAWPCDFLQINYSLAEPEAAERLLPLCAERGIAVVVNRPFAEGAMFRAVRGRAVPDWVAPLGVKSWAQYFLKWILGHPAVTCVIPATSKVEHLADNLAAGVGELPDEALRQRMATHFRSA